MIDKIDKFFNSFWFYVSVFAISTSIPSVLLMLLSVKLNEPAIVYSGLPSVFTFSFIILTVSFIRDRKLKKEINET